MWGRGAPPGRARASSEDKLHVLLFGLLLIFITSLSSCSQASSLDGVQSLECFSKPRTRMSCMWKPGKHGSNHSFTLVLKQESKNICRAWHSTTHLIDKILLRHKNNITVEVFTNPKTPNCTKAVFSGSPHDLVRCEPPTAVLLSRKLGSLDVNLMWHQDFESHITKFSLEYKLRNSSSWKGIESNNTWTLTVKGLEPLQTYDVRVRCGTNEDCRQCLWSNVYTAQSELTKQPIITRSEETEISSKTGQRRISLSWKIPAGEAYDRFHVTGRTETMVEDNMTLSVPEITLMLSYSAYELYISAVNGVSMSPAVSLSIPRRDGSGDGRLKVTVHSNTSFSLRWRSQSLRTIVCYMAEWSRAGRLVGHKSFFEDHKASVTFSLEKPLEPYSRYSVTLHTRPNKNTCKMKRINGTESTYGTAHFYSLQGAPAGAPSNISLHNVTVSSAELQWSHVPEEVARGFLLGYIIHYAEAQPPGPERNVTVAPEVTSYKLEELKSGSAYRVQMSAFTSAGAGDRSAPSSFKTNHRGHLNLGVLIPVSVVMIILMMFGSPLIKKAKIVLLPSIPNPGESSAVQKIDGPRQLELLGALKDEEEWDAKGFELLEREPKTVPGPLASALLLLGSSEEEETTGSDTDGPAEETFISPQRTDAPPLSLAGGGYTTMEMFQQLMPGGEDPMGGTEGRAGEPIGPKRVRVEYVRQFSSSPPSDGE